MGHALPKPSPLEDNEGDHDHNLDSPPASADSRVESSLGESPDERIARLRARLAQGRCPWHPSVSLRRTQMGTHLSLPCSLCEDEYAAEMNRVQASTDAEDTVAELCLPQSSRAPPMDEETVFVELCESPEEEESFTEDEPLGCLWDFAGCALSLSLSPPAETETTFSTDEDFSGIEDSPPLYLSVQTDVSPREKEAREGERESEMSWTMLTREEDTKREFLFRSSACLMDIDVFLSLVQHDFTRHCRVNCFPYNSPLRRATAAEEKTTLVLTMLGEGPVGKSSLLRQYMSGSVEEEGREEENILRKGSRGPGFHSRCFQHIPGVEIRLDIRDFPSLSVFQQQSWAVVQRSNCVVVVFSVDSGLESRWLPLLRERLSPQCRVVVCLNKIDLPAERWLFTRKDFYAFVHKFGFCVVETSAKRGINVDELFFYCVCCSQTTSH